MKRLIAVFFVFALALTMVSGCCGTKNCSNLCAEAQAKLDQVEQSCTASANAAQSAAQRAEAAARRAEAAADKCEASFGHRLKK